MRCMISSRPISLVELKGLFANTWSNIQMQELESLAAPLPKRIAAVIRAKGDRFKSSQNTKCHILLFFN